MTEDELITLATSLNCIVQYDVEQRENMHGDVFELPVYVILHEGAKLIAFYAVVVEDWLQPDEARRFLVRELERKTRLAVSEAWMTLPTIARRREMLRQRRIPRLLQKGA